MHAVALQKKKHLILNEYILFIRLLIQTIALHGGVRCFTMLCVPFSAYLLQSFVQRKIVSDILLPVQYIAQWQTLQIDGQYKFKLHTFYTNISLWKTMWWKESVSDWSRLKNIDSWLQS